MTDPDLILAFDNWLTARDRQIVRWLRDARETRGAEFTPEKQSAWLDAQRQDIVKMRVQIGMRT